MNQRAYTIMVVPEGSSDVQRYKVAHRLLLQIGGLAALGAAFLLFLLIHYLFVVMTASDYEALRLENLQLRSRFHTLQTELQHIEQTMLQIEQFTERVRAITQISDPERNLALGPSSNEPEGTPKEVLYASGERIDYEDEVVDSKLAMRLMNETIDHTTLESHRLEQGVKQLYQYLEQQDLRLANTPSLRPVRSKVTLRTFGLQHDPFTDQDAVHKGIDFAADLGAEVIAPADGLVIFAGARGNGYGETIVIDHGFATQTHYAHLSKFHVKVGDVVRRGQLIAAVGNSGRSIGAHLHYEVRIQGVPQDPERFLLEQDDLVRK